MRFHEVTHSVYFDDLDAFQILHNARYLLLIERTIGDFWRMMGWGGPLKARRHPDQHHLVRLNHFEYHRAVHDVDRIRARVWVERIGRTSLTFGFEVRPIDMDTPYATGQRVLVRVDPDTRAPVPWSETFREKLAPYRADLDLEEES
ncbi:MAG: acyl-CoA thioester hydrolase [Myxococcota bacterium]